MMWAELFIGMGIAVACVGIAILLGYWSEKWQAKRQNAEKPTDTPITGETRVSIPVSTAKFETAFRRATEQNADKPGRRKVSNMEIQLEVKRTYTVTMNEAEMKRLTTILDLWYSGQTALSSAASSTLRDFARDFPTTVENAERV